MLKFRISRAAAVSALFLLSMQSRAATEFQMTRSGELQKSVHKAVNATLEAFEGLKPDELAVTLIDLRNPDRLEFGAHRGSVPGYPASVIKLFYLEAAHRWIEDVEINDTVEVRRALRDMVVNSYNEATHYIVDLLTGTTSGPELPPAAMKQWEHKRNAINRYFARRGFTGINANQKPWCEGPYGRERVFVGETNRNALTTDATARLMAEIALGRAVTRERSKQMLELLVRDPFAESRNPDDQAHGFTGPAVPKGAKLWSKAGWTSQTRHDAAYIELPNGEKFVLVVFTVNHANERKIIPTLAKSIIGDFDR